MGTVEGVTIDYGALVSLVIGSVLAVMGWLINRNIGHIDQRQERMEHKQDAFMEKIEAKIGDVHSRITNVATDHAQLAGEFHSHVTESRGNLKKFPK